MFTTSWFATPSPSPAQPQPLDHTISPSPAQTQHDASTRTHPSIARIDVRHRHDSTTTRHLAAQQDVQPPESANLEQPSRSQLSDAAHPRPNQHSVHCLPLVNDHQRRHRRYPTTTPHPPTKQWSAIVTVALSLSSPSTATTAMCSPLVQDIATSRLHHPIIDSASTSASTTSHRPAL